MKLYTEEQIKEAIKLARVHKPNDFITWFHNYDDDIIDSLTPIELPSDEEIESLPWGSAVDNYYVKGFTEGAKWVIEQIKKDGE